MITQREFHKVCKALKTKVDNGRQEKYYGICYNLESMLHNADAIKYIKKYQESWPLYTGDSAYPVPDNTLGLSPEDAYNRMIDLWKGEYGQNRKSLLDHLIKASG
jgi:hypothetical protein